MKKLIFIMNVLDTMKGLKKGKRIEGALYVDKNTGLLTFKPYFRKPQTYTPDKLICYLDEGWVKESARRIKVHVSINKLLGIARIISILDRNSRDAKNALINKEMEESL
jgi:hypothetical protein